MTDAERVVNEERKAELNILVEHILALLDARYGSVNVTLEHWQALCRDVNEPEGSTIAQCKLVSFRAITP